MFDWINKLHIDVVSKMSLAIAEIPDDEPILADHFPGQPMFPGSLLIELAAQASGPLAEAVAAEQGHDLRALLGMVRDIKFLYPVYLPAKIYVQSKIRRLNARQAQAKVLARVGEQEVLKGVVTMVFIPAHKASAEAELARAERLRRWKGGAQ